MILRQNRNTLMTSAEPSTASFSARALCAASMWWRWMTRAFRWNGAWHWILREERSWWTNRWSNGSWIWKGMTPGRCRNRTTDSITSAWNTASRLMNWCIMWRGPGKTAAENTINIKKDIICS